MATQSFLLIERVEQENVKQIVWINRLFKNLNTVWDENDSNKSESFRIKYDAFGFPVNIKILYRFPQSVCIGGSNSVINHAQKRFPELFI